MEIEISQFDDTKVIPESPNHKYEDGQGIAATDHKSKEEEQIIQSPLTHQSVHSKWSDNRTSRYSHDESRGKKSRKLDIRCGLAFFVAIVIIIGLSVWLGIEIKNNRKKSETEAEQQHQTTTNTPQTTKSNTFPKSLRSLEITPDIQISIGEKLSWNHDISTMTSSTLNNPNDCSNGDLNTLCIEWPNDRRLIINVNDYANKETTSDTVTECYNVEWRGLNCVSQIITDCFNITTAHWYGGFEEHYQYWPFEKNNITQQPYVSGDAYSPGIGDVLERYFVTSNGIGIYIDNEVPLYFRMNNPEIGQMCFTAKYEPYPYYNPNKTPPYLSYIMCVGENVKMAHSYMTKRFIPFPDDFPSSDVFRYPIFSTWAQYHYDINQTNVVQFAKDIQYNNFTCCQVEIDDVWTPKYGDLVFDDAKFPNASEMVDAIHKIGFNVTLWVHPFFNYDCKAFLELKENDFLIRQLDSKSPAHTSWWNGDDAGMIDMSNSDAQDWYLEKLENLKTTYGVDSFKFDAGEVNWLPNSYSIFNRTANPSDVYPKLYVQTVLKSDQERRQEVRAGYKTRTFLYFFGKWINFLHGAMAVLLR